MVHDAGSASHREEVVLETDQASGRNTVFKTNTAFSVRLHVLQVALSAAELFHDGTLVVFFHVNGQHFERFHLDAVNFFVNDAGTGYGQFVAFTTHVFDQNGQVQFTAASHFENAFVVGRLHAHGDVAL